MVCRYYRTSYFCILVYCISNPRYLLYSNIIARCIEPGSYIECYRVYCIDLIRSIRKMSIHYLENRPCVYCMRYIVETDCSIPMYINIYIYGIVSSLLTTQFTRPNYRHLYIVLTLILYYIDVIIIIIILVEIKLGGVYILRSP